MRYAIKVNSLSCGAETAQTLGHIIRALRDRGHEIELIFLAQGAVALAFEGFAELGCAGTLLMAATERPVVYCSSAAAQRFEGLSPLPGFELGGLGQWVEAVRRSDRILCFGGG